MKRTAKDIDIPTVMMKTIGKKTYIVENYFSEDARTYVTDKVHHLIDRELKKNPAVRRQMLYESRKQSYHQTDRFGYKKEGRITI